MIAAEKNQNITLPTIDPVILSEETSVINKITDILMGKKGGIENLLPNMADKYPQNPDLQMLAAIMFMFSFSKGVVQSEFPKYLGRINKAALSQPQQMHYNALFLIQNNDFDAAFAVYCDLIYLNPQDTLAVVMLETVCFMAGKINESLKPYEFLYPHYKDNPNFLNMLAFLYSHLDQHEKGQALIKIALEKDPHNAWVQHGYAHLILPSQIQEGITFLEQCTGDWPKQNRFFEVHNWMHLCTLYLEQPGCDGDSIIHNYHKHIWGEAKEFLFEQNNAFLTLWHLELAVKTGKVSLTHDIDKLWIDVAKYAEPFTRDYFTPYLTITAILTIARVDPEKAKIALSDFETFAKTPNGTSSKYHAWYETALPALKGCMAYLNGNYKLAVEILEPIHNMTVPMGHSDEQRSIFGATYLVSKAYLI